MTAKRVTGREASGQPGFEKSLARLEAIVAEMESGSLGLEDMIARFEEGQSLLKVCAARLAEVERRVELLVRKGDAVAAEPFAPEAGDNGTAAGAEDDGGTDAEDGGAPF